MRRLTDLELDARIHKFLRRKLAEFPDLMQDDEVQPRNIWSGRRMGLTHHHTIVNWGAKAS